MRSGAGNVLIAGESWRMISGLFWIKGLRKLKTDPKLNPPDDEEGVDSSNGFWVVTACCWTEGWNKDVNWFLYEEGGGSFLWPLVLSLFLLHCSTLGLWLWWGLPWWFWWCFWGWDHWCLWCCWLVWWTSYGTCTSNLSAGGSGAVMISGGGSFLLTWKYEKMQGFAQWD